MSTLEIKVSPMAIEKTIGEISNLISLPEIYLKIRRLMDDPNTSIDEFIQVVGCDPNLSATLLKVVNSAFFGFPGHIESISRGVVLLGVGQLHDMVLGASAISSLNLPNEIMPLKTFWRCSLFSAVLTRLLAAQLKIRNADRLFVIGLLHEIGHLVIYSKYPEQAKLAIESFQEGKQLLHSTEQQLLGLHYGQVGARLMAQWQLPVNFQQITQYQPTPANALEHRLETMLLHVTHGYAHQFVCETDLALEQWIMPEAWATLCIKPDQVESTLETACQVCSDFEKLLLI